jgi:hypothetical protein
MADQTSPHHESAEARCGGWLGIQACSLGACLIEMHRQHAVEWPAGVNATQPRDQRRCASALL